MFPNKRTYDGPLRFIFFMRYHFEKPYFYFNMYGKTYECKHPLYNRCTLFVIDDRGIAVVQQRFDPIRKTTWWGPIDIWLTDKIYLNPLFKEYFDKYSKVSIDGLYPTVTVRSIMHSLKMKPIKKESWETVFDRRFL